MTAAQVCSGRSRKVGLLAVVAMVVALTSAVASASPAAATGGGTIPVVSSTAVLNRGGSELRHLGCASSSFCVALTTDATQKPAYRVFGGSTWSAPIAFGDPNVIESLSCAPSATTLCVAVDSANNATVFNGSTWSPPAKVDSTARFLDSVSCASATFCMAVDTVDQASAGCASACVNAFTFNGVLWSGPSATGLHMPDGAVAGSSVSCTAKTFCMLINSAQGPNDYVIYNGTTFASPKSTGIQDGAMNGLTCAGPSLCLGLLGGLAQGQAPVEWDGASWSQVNQNIAPVVVSCAVGTTFCIAGPDVAGSQINRLSAGVWTKINTDPDLDAEDFGSGVSIGEISCPSAAFCLAVDTVGNFLKYTGTAFSAPSPVGSTGRLEHVSCAGASFCAATDEWGRTFTFNGTSWSSGLTSFPTNPLTDLSCAPSTTFCVGVNFHAAFTFNGTTWSAPSATPVGTSVSCATATFCVAVGGSTYRLFNGSVWSPAATFDGSGSADGVSCSSTTFCVATDTSGLVFTFNGSAWANGPDLGMPGLGSGNAPDISCPSSSFCVAVDTSGNMASFDGVGWTSPVSIGGTGLTVGCASGTRTCLAVDNSGAAFVHVGSTWTGPTTIDSGNAVSGVACAGASRCLVIDGASPFPSGHALSVAFSASAAYPAFTTATPSAAFAAGHPYGYHFAASGTPTPTFALAPGAPGWLTLGSTTGVLSGSPPGGTTHFAFSAVATSGAERAILGPFEVAVAPAAAPHFTAQSPPLIGPAGSLYSYTFAASGNPAPTSALGSGAPAWLAIDSTTGLVSGTPPPGTAAFTYSVVAGNGVSPSATAGPFTVAAATVPAAPTIGTASGSDSHATVSWAAPSDNGGSAVTGYVVTSLINGVAQVPTTAFGPTATSGVVGGLTNGTAYSFRVAATNAVGTGANSAATGLVVPPFASPTAFVQRQFSDVMGRAPTSTELSSDLSGLAGGESPAAIVAALRRSTDATTNVDPTTRLYFAYFLRIPDQGGLTYWIGRKRGGTSLYAISDFFASSTEFKTRYGSLSNLQFVNLVYQNVLGRPGDAGGTSYWTGQLDTKAKTRGQVMVGFSESPEYRTKQQPSADVAVAWIDLLGAAPGTTDFNAWVTNLTSDGKTITDLAAAIMAMPAYATRVG